MLCECIEVENTNESTTKPKIFSEIEDTGRPYKTIEAIINNNRIVLRIQKLAIEEAENWESSCKSLPNLSEKQSEAKYLNDQLSYIIRSQSPRSPLIHSSPLKSQNEQLNTSNGNEIIENPNIFLLKIRKRSETWDKKKENIDLEFRAPRPWPVLIPKKSQKIEKISLENKQNERMDKKEESMPPKENTEKNEKTKKKKKKIKRRKKGTKKK